MELKYTIFVNKTIFHLQPAAIAPLLWQTTFLHISCIHMKYRQVYM